MKNPILPIKQKYYDLLNGIVVSGVSIPVYETLNASNRPFILFSNYNAGNDQNDKNGFNNRVSISLEIQVSNKNLIVSGSSKMVHLIMNAITETILAAGTFDSFNQDFKIISSTWESEQPLPVIPDGDGLIYRSLITFTHWVENL